MEIFVSMHLMPSNPQPANASTDCDSPELELSTRFFEPLTSALSQSKLTRRCKSISDEEWLHAGVIRALDSVQSGRDFLQKINPFPDAQTARSAYFEGLKSERRLGMASEVAATVAQSMIDVMPDGLAEMPNLEGFDVFAGDGHWHEHATHDRKKTSHLATANGDDRLGRAYFAVGHFYGLNLRSNALVHLAHADEVARKKEHDMRALRRMEISMLRQGAKKGRRVLWVWDRAGIDFADWNKWKQGSGIYFLSRGKKNMLFHPQSNPEQTGVTENEEWDRDDPINSGVLREGFFESAEKKIKVRFVEFYDAAKGETFSFVTNLPLSVTPGEVAQLFRMRWDIEKVFDDVKNKQDEEKAWATSSTAKSMQATFIALSHNLMCLLERWTKDEHGIENVAEDRRRDKRMADLIEDLTSAGKVLPELVIKLKRCTQLSVKFIRWIRYEVLTGTPLNVALTNLREYYACL